ncbi:protein of unknown function DUF182 [Desulfofarcimen acetoxidans DSM 771]|uniref:Xanthine dehydrogenase n=1 Tax=Desulfofarcimen acetoxidans (strain ATCC 49208 / DSM 771 / KCTC 5769 / VKM B-1644 / 5575) TaxID=485916 RepID=C8W6P7_DESAS|nr:XdhC/CoxI family protein [Desulfofarcimen acetoxidans]ACV64156.1 protein of unknown function DUF182 [Desulfofarcimen acetoxidans DSM 771]
MSDMLQSVCRLLEDGQDLVLATILSQSGSTPRTAGTKMIVLSDGKIIGTIGGGLVEAAVQKTAAEVWLAAGGAQVKVFDLTGADAQSMDMICGGRLEILIEYVTSDPANLQIYKELDLALRKSQRLYLITVLGQGPDSKGQLLYRAVIDERSVLKESILSDTAFNTEKLNELISITDKSRYPVVFNVENQKIIVEPCFGTGTVYLYGAGHVSQQVASLAALVDFRTIVLDDRKEFANRERFKQADRVEVITSFTEPFADPAPGADSYVVIVTRGHSHDKTVLAQVLRTKAKYIGMIGSNRKRDAIYTALLQEGFTQEDLNRVYCPIGLEIGAETPEEIAVSIVAELVKHRAQRA